MSEFDAFEFRVRSDGRRFIANVSAPDFVRKDDVWQTFFFPRGGPEWENITVSSPCREGGTDGEVGQASGRS